MILKNTFVLFFLLQLTIVVNAQQDTAFNRVITLREVVVQPDNRLFNTKEKKQEPDLQMATDQLLERIAGVHMIRRGSYAWEPAIRGLNAGQINTTISGMAIFGACTDRMDPVSSYIEPNNLQSISVNYGSGDQAFGSSVGGGLNFKIRQPQFSTDKKFTGLAGIGYESNGHGLQSLAALEYSGNRFAIRGNGIFRQAGDYRAGGGELISFSQYHKWNGGISAKYKLAKHHLLSTDYLQDEGWNIGYPALLMDVAYAKAKIGSLSYLYQPHNERIHHWETKLYFNTIQHAMDDTHRPKEQVHMHMDMPGTSNTMGFYSEIKWNAPARHQITTRINGYRNRLHAEMTMYPEEGAPMYMLTIPDAQRTVGGIDVSDKLELTDRIDVVAGLRGDIYLSSIYSLLGKQQLSGMHEGDLKRNSLLYNAYVNVKYGLSEHWQVYGNLARAMRGATLQEQYGFYLFNRADGFDYLGNPFLSNEKSWNLSAGAEFQKGEINIETQAFTYLFENYIAGKQVAGYHVMTQGALGVKQYVNISSAILCGAETILTWKPFSFLNVKSVNTYTWGKDGEGYALPMISPFKTVNGVTGLWKKYRLQVTSETSLAQKHVSVEAYGETPSKGYSIVNAVLGRSFSLGALHWDFNVELNNIFNTYYYAHLDVMKLPRPGRNLVIHLTFKF